MSDPHNNMYCIPKGICGNDDITHDLLFIGDKVLELSPKTSIGTLFNIQVKPENLEEAVERLKKIYGERKMEFIEKTLTKEDNEKMVEFLNSGEAMGKIMMKYGMTLGPDHLRLEESAFHNIKVILSRLKNVDDEYNKQFLKDMVNIDGLKQELLDEALSK